MNARFARRQFRSIHGAIFAVLAAIPENVGVEAVNRDHATFLSAPVPVAVSGSILCLRAMHRRGMRFRR